MVFNSLVWHCKQTNSALRGFFLLYLHFWQVWIKIRQKTSFHNLCLRRLRIWVRCSVWACAFVCIWACVQTAETLPVLAIVPPAGAFPPSSSSAFGSPESCACGRCAPSDILLHKSQSADTRQKYGSEPTLKPYHAIWRHLLWWICAWHSSTTWWCSSPSHWSLFQQ